MGVVVSGEICESLFREDLRWGLIGTPVCVLRQRPTHQEASPFAMRSSVNRYHVPAGFISTLIGDLDVVRLAKG
jgi:hypothetical protein